MNQIITSNRPDVDFDPDSLTDPEQRRLDAIKDLDNLLLEYQGDMHAQPQKVNIPLCYISIKSTIKNVTYKGVFELIAMQQPSYRGSQYELIIHGSPTRLLKLFKFYQSQITNINKTKKPVYTGTLRSFLKKRKRYRSRVEIKTLMLYHEKSKIDLLNQQALLINDIKYHMDGNKSYLTISSST